MQGRLLVRELSRNRLGLSTCDWRLGLCRKSWEAPVKKGLFEYLNLCVMCACLQVAAIKKQQAEDATREAAKQRLAAAEQRAAALRQMDAAGRVGAPGPAGGAMHGRGFAGADAFRRMHMQQMMAARQQHAGKGEIHNHVPSTVCCKAWKSVSLQIEACSV